MKILNPQNYLELHKQFEATQTEVPTSDIKLGRVMWTYREGKEEPRLAVYSGTSQVGVLSDRAVGNVSRTLGIPKGLMTTLSEDTLNRIVRERILAKALDRVRVRFNPDIPNLMQSFVDTNIPDVRVSRLLDGVAEDLVEVRGDFLKDDSLFFRLRGLPVQTDREDVELGQSINLSQIGHAPYRFSEILYREICTNGMIGIEKSHQVKYDGESSTPAFIRATITFRMDALPAKVADMEQFYQTTSAKAINPEPEELMLIGANLRDNNLVPGALSNRFDQVAQHFHVDETVRTNLHLMGIPTLDNAWMIVNLITHLAKEMPSETARLRSEQGAYRWALTA